MSNHRAPTRHIQWLLVRWLIMFNIAMLPSVAQANSAEGLPAEVTISGVEFVLIPESWFFKTGGLPAGDAPFESLHDVGEGNVKVWLDSFYIAKYEARASDLVNFLNANSGEVEYELGQKNCSVDRTWYGRYVQKAPTENRPATHLSWQLTDQWAQWMGFRLPTEAEWEKAARGDDQRLYPWGDDYPDETYAGFQTSSYCFTWPVDSFQKGVSPYGVYNMAGNVREYVADWYSLEQDMALKAQAAIPPAVLKDDATTLFNQSQQQTRGPWKMLKGGRWAAIGNKIKIGARVYWSADIAFRCNGARFALDLDSVRTHLNNGTAEITRP